MSQLQKRLEQLSKRVTPLGLYHDDDVRASINAMPRPAVERLIFTDGYTDINANRATPLTCTVADMYGQMNECARSFVNFLRAYRSSWGKGSSDFSSPEWVQAGDSISVTFDSRFYELVFDANDLTLRAVKYRAQEE